MNPLDARRRLLGRNVYKKTVEGNPAIAQGSLSRRYPGIEMQGWTEQDNTTGAQLFDISTSQIGAISRVTGQILEYGANWLASDYIPVISGGQYSCTYATNYGDTGYAFYDESKVFLSGVPCTTNFTVPESAVFCRITVNTTDSDPNIFMLNEGSTALPYEPYTGGAPSPSPDYPQEIVSAGNWNEETQKWEYEVKLTGKNLFDQSLLTSKTQSGATVTNNGDGSFTISGEGQLDTNGFIQLSGISGDEARKLLRVGRIFSNNPTAVPRFYCYAYDADNNVLFSTVTSTGQAIVTSEILQKMSRLYFVFHSVSGETITPVTIWPMVWQYGDGAWEPYKPPQTVTLTSDRPLTKWDKLEKRNGQWGWVYKSIIAEYDGSADEVWTYISDDTSSRVYTRISGVDGESFCDKFIEGIALNEGYYDIADSIYLRFNVHNIAESASSWKTWLQSNPITVWCETDTKTFVPLSETEQTQMNALHTNRPTTALSNNQDCEMSLTYKTRKSMEVTT